MSWIRFKRVTKKQQKEGQRFFCLFFFPFQESAVLQQENLLPVIIGKNQNYSVSTW